MARKPKTDEDDIAEIKEDNIRRDLIRLLIQAKGEITDLRAQVRYLEPKARAYDNMSKLINVTIPDSSRGEAVDVAWLIDREINRLSDDAVKEANSDVD